VVAVVGATIVPPLDSSLLHAPSKASEAIRAFAGRLAASLKNELGLEQVIADLCEVLKKTCQRNNRSKPGTFEMLNDSWLSDFCLT